uniref:Uncharacterized protein n=1 Tax=Rhizophora mucronata TaxID=61149 RepID=A0A2P2KHS9_RHIMU
MQLWKDIRWLLLNERPFSIFICDMQCAYCLIVLCNALIALLCFCFNYFCYYYYIQHDCR